MMMAADAAQLRGFDLAFLPIMGTKNWGWRGFFNPKDVDLWFRNYTAWMLKIAVESEKRGLGELVIGSEFKIIYGYESHWRKLVAEIRKVYTGALVLTANWDSYKTIQFWDAVDAIGVSAYFPLSNKMDPPQAELDAAWAAKKKELLALSKKWNRPLHVTEVGYSNEDSTAMTPWEISSPVPKQNDALQARCFEAFRKAWKDEKQLVRVNVWSSTGGEAARQPIAGDPVGRPAEKVIEAFVTERRALTAPTASGGTPISAAGEPPRVALTIDDIPVHASLVPGQTRLEIMKSVTDAIRKHGLPPVHGFFNGFGMNEPGADQVMNLWLSEGHKLANHGYWHVGINDTPLDKYFLDIENNESLLEALQPGRGWMIFRHPNMHEGETKHKRDEIRKYLAKRGYAFAPVTIDSADWAFKSPYHRCAVAGDAAAVSSMKAKYLDFGLKKLTQSREAARRLFGREVPQILLIHAGAFGSQVLDDFLAQYIAAGVKFIGLEEALADPAYGIDSGYVSRGGKTYWDQLLDKNGLSHPPGPSVPERELEKLCKAP